MENKNDLKGPQPKDIISKMKENEIIYNILMINDKLEKMVDVFKSWEIDDKESMIRTFEMKDGLQFDMITKSVIDQIAKAVENSKNI